MRIWVRIGELLGLHRWEEETFSCLFFKNLRCKRCGMSLCDNVGDALAYTRKWFPNYGKDGIPRDEWNDRPEELKREWEEKYMRRGK